MTTHSSLAVLASCGPLEQLIDAVASEARSTLLGYYGCVDKLRTDLANAERALERVKRMGLTEVQGAAQRENSRALYLWRKACDDRARAIAHANATRAVLLAHQARNAVTYMPHGCGSLALLGASACECVAKHNPPDAGKMPSPARAEQWLVRTLDFLQSEVDFYSERLKAAELLEMAIAIERQSLTEELWAVKLNGHTRTEIEAVPSKQYAERAAKYHNDTTAALAGMGWWDDGLMQAEAIPWPGDCRAYVQSLANFQPALWGIEE